MYEVVQQPRNREPTMQYFLNLHGKGEFGFSQCNCAKLQQSNEIQVFKGSTYLLMSLTADDTV